MTNGHEWRPSRRGRAAVAGLVLVCLGTQTQCGSTDDRDAARDWRGSVDTLAGGIVHVSNPTEGVWREGEGWSLREDLRLGRSDGDGPELFGRIAALAVSADGDILVADGITQQVRVFDRDGAFRTSFGRLGGGPGEFRNISGMAWDRDGRLWVADLGNARFSLYGDDYVPLGNAAIQLLPFAIPWGGGFDRDGRIYDLMTSSDGEGWTTFSFVRADPDSRAWTDTLPPIRYYRSLSRPAPRRMILARSRLTVRFDPNGYLWFAETGDYRITQRTWSGDTIRIVERVHTPARISDAERDSIVQDLREWPPNLPETYGIRDIPEVKPAIDRIYVGADGHLIVQPRATPELEGRLFDVFSPTGVYLGPITSPVRFSTLPATPLFDRDAIYGVSTDSLGAEQVVRMRITDRRIGGEG